MFERECLLFLNEGKYDMFNDFHRFFYCFLHYFWCNECNVIECLKNKNESTNIKTNKAVQNFDFTKFKKNSLRCALSFLQPKTSVIHDSCNCSIQNKLYSARYLNESFLTSIIGTIHNKKLSKCFFKQIFEVFGGCECNPWFDEMCKCFFIPFKNKFITEEIKTHKCIILFM